MGKIFCIMGKSSSGKDTIFKILKDNINLNLKGIVPYTTRPKRKSETNGIEYYFIDEKKLNEYKEAGKVIESRVYHTVNGKWFYATLDDEQINLSNNNYIMINTLEAYKNLKLYFGKENIIPIYINLDDGTRLQRALDREKQQKNPNYNELCRRFLADNIDFSIEELNKNSIVKYYDNHDLNICVQKITKDILNYI